MRHLIIGGSHPTAVGQSLRDAASQLELAHSYLDYDQASRAPRLVRAFCWRVLGKRPPKLISFNRAVLERCTTTGISWVHCVGNLALTAATIRQLRERGVRCSIWLTDDPWNEAHRSRWVMAALPGYDVIFTPRRSNMAQLDALAPGRVAYLPFGYDPRYFHPVPDAGPPVHELLFAGGADAGRARYMTPLINAGLQVGLYGAYWDRYPQTREAFRGYAAPNDLATLIARSRVCLCLIRSANRDGHCMRTFELAAVGACILAEDTAEHRALFGADGEAVAYITSGTQAAVRCRELLDAPDTCQRMIKSVRSLMTEGRHTYTDRLSTLLEACHASAPR